MKHHTKPQRQPKKTYLESFASSWTCFLPLPMMKFGSFDLVVRERYFLVVAYCKKIEIMRTRKCQWKKDRFFLFQCFSPFESRFISLFSFFLLQFGSFLLLSPGIDWFVCSTELTTLAHQRLMFFCLPPQIDACPEQVLSTIISVSAFTEFCEPLVNLRRCWFLLFLVSIIQNTLERS